MVSFKHGLWCMLTAGILMMSSCSQEPEKGKITGNSNQNQNQNTGNSTGNSGNTGNTGNTGNSGNTGNTSGDPCYAASLQAPVTAAPTRLASAAYEEINTKVLKETCAANSCHGPDSDFRPWVDNEPNFKAVAARVRFRVLNKLRKHYFPPDKISDDNYRLMKQYVDSIPNSGVPAGCQVDYRP